MMDVVTHLGILVTKVLSIIFPIQYPNFSTCVRRGTNLAPTDLKKSL